ncbi:hypothetical protein HDV03_004921 [Kappamyces sp. JEL0829]|nr:hypothetical protein HDV03_004921 [Kappamyces sp. JEL0829]
MQTNQDPADNPQPQAIEYNPEALSSPPEQSTNLRLDELGPVVVNEDGTLSRITNWHQLSESEQKNTMRVLAKRNQQRLGKLKMAGESSKEAAPARSSDQAGS